MAVKAASAIGSVIRVGLGVIAIMRVQSLVDAARVIKDHQPFLAINPDTDTDINWQRNRPRTAAAFKGSINCLVRWQSILQQRVRIFVPGPFTGPGTQAGQAFARMETDVNTNADNLSIEYPTLSAVEELYEITEAILRGD
jgi:hypothetical protein